MADDRNENRLEDRSDQNQELTDNFRFLLSNPNGRTYKQEAIMMGFGLMSGERDELIEYIKALKESGFFDKNYIEVKGTKISPLDVTSSILFKEWKLGEEEEEITVMRITLKGENSLGQIEEVTYDLHDEYCHSTKTSSMSRTTGYTATAAANLFLEGLFSEKGVFPPELVGRHRPCFEYFLNYLKERNIHYVKKSRILEK